MNINLTLIGQSITFFLFVYFCAKYVWPPILAAMAERETKIADGLQAAERASLELSTAKEDVSRQLEEAKAEASAIIEQANKRARQVVEEAKEQAVSEGERLKEAAKADIDQEVNRAKEQLRREVSVLAIAGAEQILEAEIDENAHRSILDKLSASL